MSDPLSRLPVLAAFLPVAGVMAEAEWIHKALVLIALPITAFAVLRHGKSKARFSFIAPATLGLALLLAAAFVEALHDFETELTVIGAVFSALAHPWHWANRTDEYA